MHVFGEILGAEDVTVIERHDGDWVGVRFGGGMEDELGRVCISREQYAR